MLVELSTLWIVRAWRRSPELTWPGEPGWAAPQATGPHGSRCWPTPHTDAPWRTWAVRRRMCWAKVLPALTGQKRLEA